MLALMACASLAAPSAAADRPTPSGLPVPRYVSLKFDNVNARKAFKRVAKAVPA